ncbi:hypothetical protein [Gemmatimonas sp.]|uniref:hypothetical protein n=1 Tax=Gemmatimonas sp. TaxID=1962908 RepID=UPI003982E0B1
MTYKIRISDADLAEYELAMLGPRAGGAVVGAYWSEASIVAKKNAIEEDLLALEQASKAQYNALMAVQKSKLASGVCTGIVNPLTGYNDCLSAADVKYVAWRTQFTSWQSNWSEYKRGGISSANSGQLDVFDARLKVLRTSFEALTGMHLAVAANPSEADEAGGAPVTGAVTMLVWLAGIGFVLWFGLGFVVPALVGAAATTRGSYRALRGA